MCPVEPGSHSRASAWVEAAGGVSSIFIFLAQCLKITGFKSWAQSTRFLWSCAGLLARLVPESTVASVAPATRFPNPKDTWASGCRDLFQLRMSLRLGGPSMPTRAQWVWGLMLITGRLPIDVGS